MKTVVLGPEGALEADAFDGSDPEAPFAIVCHPHPLLGGTMDNKVVTTTVRALQGTGMATVRFNFRGVAASAGTYDGGAGETLDALAVAEWGTARWPGRPVVLAGFSFGAYVALRLAQVLAPARLITIAPPIGRFDFDGLKAPACPWLILQGDADEVVDSERVREWARSLPDHVRLEMLPGVGHFFHGRLPELRDRVQREIRGDDA